MAKKAKLEARAKVVVVKTEASCNLCLQPTDDGNHEDGKCVMYERQREILANEVGIVRIGC